MITHLMAGGPMPGSGLIRQVLHLCLPSLCAACHLPLASHDAPGFCRPCSRALFAPTARCRQCGLRLGERLLAFGWTHCRHCRAAPDTVYTIAAGDYGAPLDALVQRLKYQGDLALAEALAWQMARRWQTLADKPPLPDIFVPVPGSRKRLAQRGYNQAHLLSQRLAKRLGRPARADLLHKIRDTRSQAGLNGEQRQANVGGAFRAENGVAGRRLGLVDDVLTTGATLRAARAALLAAGAAHIDFWVMARTPE